MQTQLVVQRQLTWKHRTQIKMELVSGGLLALHLERLLRVIQRSRACVTVSALKDGGRGALQHADFFSLANCFLLIGGTKLINTHSLSRSHTHICMPTNYANLTYRLQITATRRTRLLCMHYASSRVCNPAESHPGQPNLALWSFI